MVTKTRFSPVTRVKPKPTPDKSPEIYGAVVSFYTLTPDTAPDVIAGGQRAEVVALWRRGIRSFEALSLATMLPESVVRNRLIEAGELPEDPVNRYYRRSRA